MPNTASPTSRVPAILTTNGFGGSKDDQAGIGKAFADRGYAVLSYSGLGFGGSDCKITLDDPDYDGKAAKQLVSYLGGKAGIAFTDDAHTTPAPVLDVVQHGRPRRIAPTTRGSAWSAVPTAARSSSPRPASTRASTRSCRSSPGTTCPTRLAPNNTSQSGPPSTASAPTRPARPSWSGRSASPGSASPTACRTPRPTRDACSAARTSPTSSARRSCTPRTTGTLTTYQTDQLRHASVASYMRKIKVPTLIIQGQSDTLFNLNEGIANYRALKAQGTPTKMIWINGGHSGPAAPGELETGSPDPATQYVTAPDRRLARPLPQGHAVGTGPGVLLLPRLGVVHRHRDAGVRGQRDLPGRHADAYYLSGSGLVTDQSQIATGIAELRHAAGRAPVVVRRARCRRRAPAAARPAAGEGPARARSPRTRRRRPPPTSTSSGRRSCTLKVDAPPAVADPGARPAASSCCS